MERELGLQLFHRSSRRVQITKAGQTFLDGCKSFLSAMETTIENTQLVERGGIGSLRIGYTDFAIAGSLPGLLKSFQAQHAGVTLKPHHGVTIGQLEKLKDGSLDVGFVTGPVVMAHTDTCLIQQNSFVCVLYEGHPLADRKSVRLEELAQEDFVHGTAKDWEYFYQNLLPLCRKVGFTPRIVQEAYNTDGILGLVASRMGITILTESASRSGIPGLVFIPFENLPDTVSTIAIWNTEVENGAKERFVEFLLEQSSG